MGGSVTADASGGVSGWVVTRGSGSKVFTFDIGGTLRRTTLISPVSE